MASLADIILQGGRDQANSALQLAQIEADRRNANSQNITHSIATLADVFGKIPQQIAQNKRQAVEDQTNKLALGQQQQAVQGQADINQIIAGLKPNEDGVLTFDPAQLRQSFAAKNIPLSLQTQTFAALDGMNKSLAGFTQARIDHAADFSNSVLAAFPTGAIDPQSLMLIMAPAKANGLLDDKTEKAITTAVQNGADPRQLLTAFRDQSEKYKGKAVSVAPGAKLVNDTTGAVIAESAPRPVSVAPGASLVNPDSGQPVFTAPSAPTSRQDKNLLLDGKPAVVSYDPKADKYFRGGEEIAVDRLKPIPPASQGGGQPGSTLDEGGLDYAATQYRVTGAIPSLGNGNGAIKASIINRAAKQAKDLGQTPAIAFQRQAARKADQASLTQITKMQSSAEAFETKALAQADIIDDLSGKVGRTQFPVINNALLAGKERILGDSNTQQLYNAIATFTAEYAKIMEGSTGSAAASSDSARASAAKLVSAGLNKGTLRDTLALMRREMNLTLQGYDATIEHINGRLVGPSTAPPDKQTVAPPTGRFNPATGKVE